MTSYDEIKAAAIRLYSDKASPDGTKQLAEVAIALCDRLARLEERHQAEIQRLERWIKTLRR